MKSIGNKDEILRNQFLRMLSYFVFEIVKTLNIQRAIYFSHFIIRFVTVFPKKYNV